MIEKEKPAEIEEIDKLVKEMQDGFMLLLERLGGEDRGMCLLFACCDFHLTAIRTIIEVTKVNKTGYATQVLAVKMALNLTKMLKDLREINVDENIAQIAKSVQNEGYTDRRK